MRVTARQLKDVVIVWQKYWNVYVILLVSVFT